MVSLQIFILGNLSEEDRHPYDIKKQVQKPLGDTITINDGTLYYNFEVLLKKGWIRKAQVIHSENRPEKTLYAITDEGRKALQDEIYASFQKMTNIKSLYATLLFLDKVDSNKLAYIIEEKITKINEKLQLFGRSDVDLSDFSESKLQGIRLISEHAHRMISSDKEFLEKLLLTIRKKES